MSTQTSNSKVDLTNIEPPKSIGVRAALPNAAHPSPPVEDLAGVDDLFGVKQFRGWFDRCWPKPKSRQQIANWKHKENMAWAGWVKAEELSAQAIREATAELRADRDALALAGDVIADLAKLVTNDDGIDPETHHIELTQEEAYLIRTVAESVNKRNNPNG